ncbi:MAG: hypothetical protein KJ905_03385 [Nanoarchaeota archaeon]|nr:hypothetical protein [Nanoarchaeota archaeon]MBU1501788.1 hypothetical protein [Nanoarchaeota archaeon]
MAEKMRCEICDRIFKDVEGLTMHNLAKHSEMIPKEMKSFPAKKIRNVGISILILVIILFGVYWLVGNQEKHEAFVQCLGDSGAKMYAAYWCSACAQQKSLLGNSKNIPYVECSLPNRGGQNTMCNEADIGAYPTWIFSDGSRLVGVLSKEVLSEKTDCVFDSKNS